MNSIFKDKSKDPGCQPDFSDTPGLARQGYHKLPTTFKSNSSNEFLSASLGDVELAKDIQAWNFRASYLMWPYVYSYETTLRRGIDVAIRDYFSDSFWWRNCKVIAPQHFERLQSKTSISSFTLGDLQVLFTRTYRGRLWIKVFEPQLPEYQGRNSFFLKELDSIRRFRNTIAHHNILLFEDLTNNCWSIASILKGFDAELSDWIAKQELILDCEIEKGVLLGRRVKLGSGGGI